MNYNNALVKEYIKSIEYKPFNKFLNNTNKNIKNKFDKPIGLYDPLGENINPLTNLPYQNLYKNEKIEVKSGPLKGKSIPRTYINLAYAWTNYLVYPNTNDIINCIRNNQVTLAKAGTGTGKTVLIPKIALQSMNFQKKVIVTIPKQIITRNAASFAAQCLDVVLGEEVGYYYKGKQEIYKNNKDTKLIFTTTGSLISKICGSDPYLEEYSCVVIDEAHERSVQTDILFLFLRKALEKRKDLKIVIMSATIDLDAFRNYFPKNMFSFGEVNAGEETLFNITDYYEKKSLGQKWSDEAVNKIIHILKTSEKGDIIVFVRSGAEGRKLCGLLQNKLKDFNKSLINPYCIELEGRTDKKQQDLATSEILYKIDPDIQGDFPFTRKIVMSTNVAESSLTVDGLVYVIDSGYNFEDLYFPKENARALLSQFVSKSAVKQRRGRGGRTQDGICYHLYTMDEYNKFKEFPTPGMQKSDLSKEILDMLRLEYIKNIGDVKNILNQLIAPPSNDFINMALKILFSSGCITNYNDDGQLTDMGKALSKFRGLDIFQARALIASYYLNCKREVAAIITLSNNMESRIENLFLKPDEKRKITKTMIDKSKRKFIDKNGDFITLLNVYNSLKDHMNNFMKNNLKNHTVIDEARNWCKNNAIDSRHFIAKKDRKNNSKIEWDRVKQDSQKLLNDLIKIIQPPELRKKYFNEYKKNNKNITKNKLNIEIKNTSNVLFTNDNDTDDTDTKLDTKLDVMVGGYNAKPYELNLFPNLTSNINNFNNIVDKVILALLQGYFMNIAKLIDSKRKIYQTVFPLLRKKCQVDKECTLNSKVAANIIMYNELFMQREGQEVLKLNMCGKIPIKVLNFIKKDYGQFINYAFSKKIEFNNDIHHNFKKKPTKKLTKKNRFKKTYHSKSKNKIIKKLRLKLKQKFKH